MLNHGFWSRIQLRLNTTTFPLNPFCCPGALLLPPVRFCLPSWFRLLPLIASPLQLMQNMLGEQNTPMSQQLSETMTYSINQHQFGLADTLQYLRSAASLDTKNELASAPIPANLYGKVEILTNQLVQWSDNEEQPRYGQGGWQRVHWCVWPHQSRDQCPSETAFIERATQNTVWRKESTTTLK